MTEPLHRMDEPEIIIVADMHEQLLDAMQQAGVDYLMRRQFTLGNVESVASWHEYVMGEDPEDIVEEAINGAIARLKKEDGS